MLIYDDDCYSQGYGQINEAFKVLTKDDILKPYISDHDSISTNVSDAGEDDNTVGYVLYIFVNRNQKNLEGAQPLKLEIKFTVVPAGIYGYA